MGLLSIFKKNKIKDELFGELKYKNFKDPKENYYYGEVSFQGSLIGIDLSANKNGPTEAQKDFFKEIELNYKKIKEESVNPFLENQFNQQLNNIELDGISIHFFENDKTKWELTYNAKQMKKYILIQFVGMQIQSFQTIE